MAINKDMTVTEIINVNPQIANILMGMGMHCIGCMAASGESLEQAMMVHGYAPEDADLVVDQINDFLSKQEVQA